LKKKKFKRTYINKIYIQNKFFYMANITDTTNLNGHVDLKDGKQNWISQINAGGTTYDIATHHSVTFVEGNGGAKTVWNGLTDLEVVIPSIQDIVQTPIEFAGTVDGDNKITWVNGHSEPAEAGNLVFVTVDCTFEGNACEAGDMAIYDGTKWNIVSGENQVKITGTTNKDIADGNRTVVKVGAAKDVLEVEGKALALTLDYADIDTHTTVSHGGPVEVVLGDMTVGEAYIKLDQAAGEAKTLVSDKTITYGTELTDGKVTFTGAESLVNGITFGTLTGGELASGKGNSEKTLPVSGGTLVVETAGSDFVKTVTFGDVTFADADAADADNIKIKMVTGISAVPGNEFLNGITKVEEDNVKGDFTVMGYYAPATSDTTFVEGLVTGNSVLTGIATAGSINTVEGDTFVTGLTGGVSAVVTALSVNAPDQDVLSSAKVENNVLVLGTAKAVKSVSVTPTTTTFAKTGISYTPATFTSSEFTRSGFTYVSDVKYTFGKANETTYDVTTVTKKLSTPKLDVTFGAYKIDPTNMKATVAPNTFIAEVSGGSFPTLTAGSFTTTSLTGTVGTALTTASVVVREVAAGMDSITLPGTYTLASASKGDEGAIAVGAAGESITVASTVIDLSGYVTDVTIK
jgi:hypothetical protein